MTQVPEAQLVGDPVRRVADGAESAATTFVGSSDDRILSWLRGESDIGERGYESVETFGAAEDVSMEQEPIVITVSRQRREELLRRAGWVEVNLQFLIRDFNNANLSGHMCFLQFTGPQGETTTDAVRVNAGIATYSSFWIKPNGVLRLLAVPIVGTRAQGGPVLEGTMAVPSQIPGRYVAFTATQDHDTVQIRAANEQQVSEQMQASGNVKFSILNMAEIGGGVTQTGGRTQTTTDEYLYTVRVGRPSLGIAPAQR